MSNELLINGFMPFNKISIKDACIFNPKSKLPASTGKENGKYRFFKSDTSSEIFYSNYYISDGKTLIINDGGIFNVKYFEGKVGYSDHCIGFHTKECIDEKYLYYVLEKNKKYINDNGFIGGTLKNINRDWFNNFCFDNYDYNMQKQIASFLSNVDSLIDNKKKELDKTKQFKVTMLYKMFPQEGKLVPEIRFKGFEDDWKVEELSKLVSMHARIGWQGLRKDEFLENGNIYLITGTDFYKGKVNFKSCHYIDFERFNQDKNIQIKHDDILITKDGTLGKVAYIESINLPATLNAGVFRIRKLNSNIYMKFLYQYLAADYLMKYATQKATGGTIKHLNQNILVDFPVNYCEFDEQVKIGNYFFELDKLIDNQEKEIEVLEHMKATLLSKMFA